MPATQAILKDKRTKKTKQEIVKTLRKIYGDNIAEPTGMLALKNQDFQSQTVKLLRIRSHTA